MNDDIARHLARTALRIARELQDVSGWLKGQLPEAEYRDQMLAIAAALDGVMTNLIDRPLASRPHIKAEIEDGIQRYGRYL